MMPAQESDDLQFHVPRRPSVVERWLRRIFVEDLNLKLLALAITFALWFAVSGQKKPMTKRLAGIQLSFVHAEDMEISNDPPTKIDVTLTGSSDKLAQINPMDLVAAVLVGDHTPGDHVVRLAPDRVKMDLPKGVRIEGFQPSAVSVRLEPMVKRLVAVDIKFEGRVPDGYEVSSVSSNPAKVMLAGPASRVNGVDKAPTESISVDGKLSSFDLADVAINIADQKVEVINSVVKVHVDIVERAVEKTFSDVPVRSASGADVRPRLANVILSGPPSVLAQLRSEDIKVFSDTSPGKNNELRLELPPGIQDKIKLRSVRPSSFSAVR